MLDSCGRPSDICHGPGPQEREWVVRVRIWVENIVQKVEKCVVGGVLVSGGEESEVQG